LEGRTGTSRKIGPKSERAGRRGALARKWPRADALTLGENQRLGLQEFGRRKSIQYETLSWSAKNLSVFVHEARKKMGAKAGLTEQKRKEYACGRDIAH